MKKDEKQGDSIQHYVKKQHGEREGCEKEYGDFDVTIFS
jgi:hypothetical protein